MIAALGKNGQILNVVPSSGLILVRMGEAPDSSLEVTTYFNNEIWQKLNQVICNTNIINEFNSTPTKFSLEQNYPNPFNPSTNIGFLIYDGGFVSLKVFDILGNEVATLVDEYKSAGEYKVKFNTSSGIRDLVSGIYFYQLRAGSFVQSKKMILLR
jgi:hypothetical protein